MKFLFSKKANRKAGPAVFGAVFVILCLIGACKSPYQPDAGEADIVIINDYGADLNIYLNGEFLYVLEYNRSTEIDNVAFGVYYFEARTIESDEFVDSHELDVKVRSDYAWLIDDPPDINVINEFGVDLQIFMDGEYQFEIVDEENRWILDVAYGEHLLKAIRTADGAAVASITVNVDEDADFSWTIE